MNLEESGMSLCREETLEESKCLEENSEGPIGFSLSQPSVTITSGLESSPENKMKLGHFLQDCVSRFYAALYKNLCRYYLLWSIINFYMALFQFTSSGVFIAEFFATTFIMLIIKNNPPSHLAQSPARNQRRPPLAILGRVRNPSIPSPDPHSGSQSDSITQEYGITLQEAEVYRIVRTRIHRILRQRTREVGSLPSELREREELINNQLSRLLEIFHLHENEIFLNPEESLAIRQGMPEAQIQVIPILKFRDAKSAWASDSCPICLESFEETSECIVLSCQHLYHSTCISEWLKASCECPVCKANQLEELEP